MLAPEQAKARLAEWQLPEGTDGLVGVVDRLPPNLRDLGDLLFDKHDDSSVGGWLCYQQRQKALAARLGALNANDRGRLFQLLAPRLAPALEKSWQLVQSTPYQIDYARKAFRAPRHPEFAGKRLATWLTAMVALCRRYKSEAFTPVWLATWAAHVSAGYMGVDRELGPLLAAMLNESTAEADEVFEILRQSLSGQHEIAGVGHHTYAALLLSNRPAAWELVEKTLLAAQRQEGLRQAVLECIDEAHPEAFRRMLRLILEQDLIRFSSVVRAVDVWFGHFWAAGTPATIRNMLAELVSFLEDPAARDRALQGQEPQSAFLALWCLATEDAVASIDPAQRLLGARQVELRYVAARHLANLDFDLASAALLPALADDELRVAIVALSKMIAMSSPTGANFVDERFDRIEQLVARVPEKPLKLKALVWPWTELTVERSKVAAHLPHVLGPHSPTRLIPHLPTLEPAIRQHAVTKITGRKPWASETREALLALAGDASKQVREVVYHALQETTLGDGEAERLEGYLTRTTEDLRRGALSLLLKQPDVQALASGRRLLASKNASQRVAGLELLRLLAEANRAGGECRQMAAEFQTQSRKPSKEEQTQLAEILKQKQAVATLDDALGLMNPAERTPAVAPGDYKVPFVTPATVACLVALDALVHEHRDEPISDSTFGTTQTVLLGNAWGFRTPEFEKPIEPQLDKLPFAQVWLRWFKERGPECRDRDGLELVRAMAWSELTFAWAVKDWRQWADSNAERRAFEARILGGQTIPQLRYQRIVTSVLGWLLPLSKVEAADYLLDALETAYAAVPAADLAELARPLQQSPQAVPWAMSVGDEHDWRDVKAIQICEQALDLHLRQTKLSPEQTIRRWRLARWRDEPFAGARRRRPEVEILLEAYSHGGVTLADVADHLLAPRGGHGYRGEEFILLKTLTARKPEPERAQWLARHPEVHKLVERAVERILELELVRGDTVTAATPPAHSIAALAGVETLRRILAALAKAEFKLGHAWHFQQKQDRRQTLTELAKVTFPAEGETPEDFVAVMKHAVRDKQFPEERLLQLTFLAPQWTKCVEAYFGWEHMSEGVYWFLAHMRYVGGLTENAAIAAGEEDREAQPAAQPDADAAQPAEGGSLAPARKLSAWQRLILERTPLNDFERNEGAIHVAWFRRTHEQLGDKHWQAVAEAARFAATAGQAKRARFIADVLLNKVSRRELVDGIEHKQLKENVRLLGLLPLAKGAKRQADLIERCRILREYRRYANGLSGLTKPAALLAWQIGMKNLAQTAGYADPLRLEWAVGAETVNDLATGPATVKAGDVAVTLALDDLARPVLTVEKSGKPLKSIPPDAKKNKKVAELAERVTDLKRQASAIRQSLEAAMCRGDEFTGDELKAWSAHAVLAPLLTRLVVVGEGILGYPVKGGKALRDCHDKLEPVKPKEVLRLAHPHDLLETGNWHAWQQECFRAERVQPFKQVFRELYVVTQQERTDGAVSHRYDGQQVQPRQALALFGQRGWNTADGIFKVFHDLGLTVEVFFQGGLGTPLEVEGATLAGVSFRQQERWDPIALAAVPPRLFSEVMRDLDLVVSVAHAGGVDPEASASTVEMRSALLRETCALLNLSNVHFKPSHAIIEGELAEYNVHLGSGVVHRMPGGSLCIVPVHSQHRGRLFLPFADDDPRTAEVISKVLLLARDREIKDPTILAQIRQ